MKHPVNKTTVIKFDSFYSAGSDTGAHPQPQLHQVYLYLITDVRPETEIKCMGGPIFEQVKQSSFTTSVQVKGIQL